jgi:polyhydroxyalkanoate synthase
MSTTAVPPWAAAPPFAADEWQKFTSKMAAWPKVWQVAQRVRVGATPACPTYREDNVRLLRYECDVEKRYRTPLLFVFALVNRPYILDLRAGKSVVSHFVNRGHDVYNVDWGVPTDGDRFLAVEDYVLRYLDHCVDEVRRQTGEKQVNVLGYCMGGTMTAMYAALRPEKVKNLILLAAPVDWSARDSLLSVWTDEKYFDIDRIIEVFGNAPPQWLQGSFLMLKPVQNLIEKYVTFWENMEDEKFLEDFFAMETWLNDNIPVAGETFRQFVKYLFQQNRLIQGRFELGGQRVDLKNIKCPILNLVAQNDHLVPPSQSLPFNNAVASTDRKAINFPAGHIGMAVGSRAHRDLWPKVCDWLEERNTARRT